MNQQQGISRLLKFSLVVLGFGLVAILGTKYLNRLKAPEERVSLEPDKKQLMPAEPDRIHLNTVPAPGASQSHLLGGDFKIIYWVNEIAEGCRAIFDSSFVKSSGSASSSTEVILADPGQDFQASDNVRSGIPFRRLVVAGLGPKTCFVYYERGGGCTLLLASQSWITAKKRLFGWASLIRSSKVSKNCVQHSPESSSGTIRHQSADECRAICTFRSRSGGWMR